MPIRQPEYFGRCPYCKCKITHLNYTASVTERGIISLLQNDEGEIQCDNWDAQDSDTDSSEDFCPECDKHLNTEDILPITYKKTDGESDEMIIAKKGNIIDPILENGAICPKCKEIFIDSDNEGLKIDKKKFKINCEEKITCPKCSYSFMKTKAFNKLISK